MLQMKEHKQKLASYFFQNDVVLYFESYWKRENVPDNNFWDFNKLNDRASQWKKSDILRLTRLWLQNVNEILWLTMACG